MKPGNTPNPASYPPSAWHGPRGEWLVAIQFVVFFAFILAPRWNPWVSSAWLDASETARALLLGAFGLTALSLGVFGALHLRRYLTPLPYPVDHSQLVTHGVYSLVRHPLYSSQLFAALAWVCWTLSLSHLALLVAGFVFFDYKATKEEGWLADRHPDYPAYASRVRKLIPGLY